VLCSEEAKGREKTILDIALKRNENEAAGGEGRAGHFQHHN
jgi:hypothetical protein